jgi:hypothetical protein
MTTGRAGDRAATLASGAVDTHGALTEAVVLHLHGLTLRAALATTSHAIQPSLVDFLR